MHRRSALLAGLAAPLTLVGCSGPDRRSSTTDATTGAKSAPPADRAAPSTPVAGRLADAFTITPRATLDSPWALAFLPGTDQAAVTQRGGGIALVNTTSGALTAVAGAPEVQAQGQGGMGDLVPAASFGRDGAVYVSWVRTNGSGSQAVLGRATLALDGAPRLEGLSIIWQQDPVSGSGHFSHRIALHDGLVWLSSGDRQKGSPAQRMDTNLGKILRLSPDGTPAPGNPFADRGGVAAQIWSLGHRNPLGLAFDDDGRLWSTEMGPMGGDELNLIERGQNYGWPAASNGSNYDGSDLPDHRAGDGFTAPKVFWNPSVSPSSLSIYRGTRFADYGGDAFIGALSGQALIRVQLNGADATLANTWAAGSRIRAVAEAPSGAIWIATDGAGGELLELSPH